VPDYREHIEGARDLLELAAQTPEGRAAVRRWAGQVADALPPEEPDPVLDPAAEQRRAAQVRAAQELGYDVALSDETSGAVTLHYASGLYPGPGQSPDNGGQPMQPYDLDASVQALVDDEIARYGLMLQTGRSARPQYAGLQLSRPPAREEVDDADIITTTLELASQADATFAECAAFVAGRAGGDPSRRAAELVRLARQLPDVSSAVIEADLDLARQREVDRLSTVPPDDPRVLEIIERNPGVLSRAPRRGQQHLSAIEDEDHTDHRQPSRGGEVHPEVDRLLREHGLLLGLDPNTRHPAPSARERERAQRRASTRRGLFSAEELHRQAMRSAASSRG
jgi:hypothetical protein